MIGVGPKVVHESVEEPSDVGIEHPVHAPLHQADRKSVERIVRTALRSEPVGEAEEVGFVDRAQHLDDGALDNLVLQRRHTQRSLPTVSFRDVRAPDRPRSIRSAFQPFGEVSKILFERALAVKMPAYSAGRCPQTRFASSRGTHCGVGEHRETWCRSAVNRCFRFSPAALRTRASAWACRLGAGPEAWSARPSSSTVVPFPSPRPPVARATCSAASSVLRARLTSRARASPASVLGLPGAIARSRPIDETRRFPVVKKSAQCQ